MREALLVGFLLVEGMVGFYGSGPQAPPAAPPAEEQVQGFDGGWPPPPPPCDPC